MEVESGKERVGQVGYPPTNDPPKDGSHFRAGAKFFGRTPIFASFH